MAQVCSQEWDTLYYTHEFDSSLLLLSPVILPQQMLFMSNFISPKEF